MSDQKKQLAGAVIALGATITDAMDDVPGFVPCGTPAQVILDAISTYTNADDAAAEQVTPNIVALRARERAPRRRRARARGRRRA